MFIDTHCHLFYENYDSDVDDVIRRAIDAGVTKFVVPATNHETAIQAVALAEKYPSVFACVGFHPLDLEHYSEINFKKIEELITHPKVVAVGEIGIDYFYDTHPRDFQKEIFALQIEFAITKDLPIVVHTRDSMDDALEVVTTYAKKYPAWGIKRKRGVFHCFTGTADQAAVLFEHNFFVSYPGPLTFKKSTMPDVVKKIGIENIMLETDSPFLTPVPFRGKRNEPSYVPLIAQKVSEITGKSTDEIGAVTTLNAQQIFKFPSEEL